MTNYLLTTIGAGGGCSISGTEITGSGGQGITSPPSIVKTFAQTAAIGATGASPSPGGGGGGSGGEIGCDTFIGYIVENPVNGVGAGKVQKITISSTGQWQGDGTDIQVIFPRI